MTGTSGSPTGRVRVLIADDEPALDEVLSVAVTEAARRPCPALDGRNALSTAPCRAPHAVVLDGMLPEPDGHQVLRRLRFENPGLPVLRVLSALRRKNAGRRPLVTHRVRALGYASRATGDGR
ncbi:response regulator [Streptomyces sp. NRRL B-24085]|uniref:response regulator n=1 Tax=Streptomyces sp. NRRL B-24085 TaxID=1709476 RepID=UPI00099BD915|nr:response regulator [Streptomyces sp. NRRL B-24085]